MALSLSAVEKAYEVFNELKKSNLVALSIGAFPEDLSDWTERERERVRENTVYGFDRKSDYGWENLVFFVKKPTTELKQKFDELKTKVPNSSISKPYSENKELWIFGWF